MSGVRKLAGRSGIPLVSTCPSVTNAASTLYRLALAAGRERGIGQRPVRWVGELDR
jgi:hypothetical protein